MSNVFTYVINLRDQMSGTLRRVGGSLVERKREAQNLRREVQRLNAQPINIGERLGAAFRNIPFSQYIFNPLTIAGIVGGRALKLGIDEEMRGASFEVLFGGEENARKIVDNIDAYARKTTYGKEGLSAAVQTMAGFGIAQERIMPNLKAIGEIAMGDKGKLNSLTLAFSQMSATGQLMGQDLNQMINAGFNPLLQMSKDTGKSVGVLKEEMGKGKISAEMVAQAFQKATQEGGQFYGMSEKMSQTLGGQWSLAMANINDKLLALYDIIQPYLLPAIKAFNLLLTDTGTFIDKVVGRLERWYNQHRVLGTVIIAATAALVAYKTVTLAITIATKAWVIAQGILDAVMALNPVGLIIASVVALIAVIAFLIIKIDGWGEAWQNTINGCKLIFQLYVESIKYYFNTMINGLMIGLNKIQEGWYRFKEALGLGDSTQNNQMLAQIQADTDRRKQEITDGAQNIVDLGREAMGAFKKAGQSLSWNDTTLADVTNGLKSKLGISTAGVPGMEGMGGSGSTGTGGTPTGESGTTANNITTGGSKTTHITFNVKEMGNNMTVNAGSIREGAKKAGDIVLEELSSALLMVTANM
ncbi:hypothetical protein D0T49_00360 [Paludibacter sp. 221]|uniref:tape measure protein n=1 Tax=Paludibacter sp. 221 TaxID=2302939 RepID=UPI0013D696D4|nr:tape measure protein [Paludibacter sp. 221]NDV45505.1 hypothetical protein [Paludibacter sp. 221]